MELTLDRIFSAMNKNIAEIKYLYVGGRGDRTGTKGKYYSQSQFRSVYKKYNNILRYGHSDIKFDLTKMDVSEDGNYLDMPFTINHTKRKTLYFIFK